MVFSADCGIILLHDPVHGAVGAAHAGWRGAAGGIVYKTVRRMQELFGTDPGDLRAAIGAAIGPCCFETDADVPQALEAFLEAENFEDALRNAVSLGGDTDTLAAMAGSIAEPFFGIPEKILEEGRKYYLPEMGEEVK